MPHHERLSVSRVWELHTHGLKGGLDLLPFASLAEAG